MGTIRQHCRPLPLDRHPTCLCLVDMNFSLFLPKDPLRVSKCHGHTDVCPHKVLLTLRKIFRFINANWKIHVFHPIFLFVDIFWSLWGALSVFLVQFLAQLCWNWNVNRAKTTTFIKSDPHMGRTRQEGQRPFLRVFLYDFNLPSEDINTCWKS